MRERSQRSKFTGFVDAWSPSISGWVIDSESPLVPVELSVIVDAQVVARVTASDPRPDVLDAGHPTAWCGFTIPIHEIFTDATPHDVAIVLTRTGEELFAPESRISFRAKSPILSKDRVGIESILSVNGDVNLVRQACANARVALVSGFRPQGGLARATSDLAVALSEAGYVVVLVDTSDTPLPRSDSTNLVVHRENVGHDFASWNTARELLGASLCNASEILLVNDSCYGPFTGLGQLFQRIDRLGFDVTSLTDGWYGSYHLQSNFLHLGNAAVRAGLLDAFFEQYDFPVLKTSIVINGEIGLSKMMHRMDLKIGAVFNYESLTRDFLAHFGPKVAQLGLDFESRDVVTLRWLITIRESIVKCVPLNTTHVFWEELLEAGMPFVKRDLLTKNPLDCPTLGKLGTALEVLFDYEDLEWIRDDIKTRGSRPILF